MKFHVFVAAAVILAPAAPRAAQPERSARPVTAVAVSAQAERRQAAYQAALTAQQAAKSVLDRDRAAEARIGLDAASALTPQARTAAKAAASRARAETVKAEAAYQAASKKVADTATSGSGGVVSVPR